jgi:hypothetical protein
LIRSARSTWQIDFEGRVHYLLHVLFAVNQWRLV